MNAPSMDVDEPESPETPNDEYFYGMWSHTHEEICDFVRRVPEVLRDAQVEPRIATAARLIWGSVPPPPENPEEIEKEERREAVRLKMLDEQSLHLRPRHGQVTQDLDWDSITDALMYISPATTHSASSLSRSTSATSPSDSPSIPSLPPNSTLGNAKLGKDMLFTPPSSEGSGSPINANASAFPMLDACAPIEAMYEPLVDVSTMGTDPVDGLFEAYAMDAACNSAFIWPPVSSQSVDPNAMSMQIMKARSVDRCSFGEPVAKDETVANVYGHFGRSPYLSS